MQDETDDSAELAAVGNDTGRSTTEAASDVRERHTPARLAFCRVLMNRCREKWHKDGCTNGFIEPGLTCMGSESESREWCEGCLLGEASVQLEWLLSKVGSHGNKASTAIASRSAQSAAQENSSSKGYRG